MGFISIYFISTLNLLIINLFLIIIYFLLAGYLTIIERKVVGIFQNRRSVSRLSFFSIYHFYLDFLKATYKGFSSKFYGLRLYYILLFILLLFLISISFVLIPVFGSGRERIFDLLVYTTIDGMILIFKLLFFYFFNYRFISISISRLKRIIFITDAFFILCIFIIIIYLYIFNNSGIFNIILFLDLLVLYSLTLFKSFRSPCDYLESESELVGGPSLELQGLGFIIWSLFEYGYFLNSFFLFGTLFYFSIFSINSFLGLNLFLIIILILISLVSRAILIRVRLYTLITIIVFSGVFIFIFIFLGSGTIFFIFLIINNE